MNTITCPWLTSLNWAPYFVCWRLNVASHCTLIFNRIPNEPRLRAAALNTSPSCSLVKVLTSPLASMISTSVTCRWHINIPGCTSYMWMFSVCKILITDSHRMTSSHNGSPYHVYQWTALQPESNSTLNQDWRMDTQAKIISWTRLSWMSAPLSSLSLQWL